MEWTLADTGLTVGVLVEVVGVSLTAFGIAQTWRDHAGGDSFWAALGHDLRRLLDSVLRRKPPAVQGSVATLLPSMTALGHATVSVSLPPDSTIEEKLDQLKQEVNRAAAIAGQAKAAAGRNAKNLEKVEERLSQQISRVQADTSSRLRQLTLEGLPLAVLGLVVSALGTLIQVGSSALP